APTCERRWVCEQHSGRQAPRQWRRPTGPPASRIHSGEVAGGSGECDAAPPGSIAMPPLRVGVVGCGGIAQMRHLPTPAQRADLFQVVALADLNERTMNAVGDRYGVRARFRDGRELAGQRDVEAVLVFASGCHREAVLALLSARKPLFVEKPLAYSLPETEEV